MKPLSTLGTTVLPSVLREAQPQVEDSDEVAKVRTARTECEALRKAAIAEGKRPVVAKPILVGYQHVNNLIPDSNIRN